MKTTDFKKEKIPDLDYSNFKVILIGVSKYPEDKKIKDVPNININIKTLSNVLTDKSIINIPKDNVTVCYNASKVNIEKKLSAFVKNTNENDTVIIYYTGHGFISSESFELHLATADTHLDYIDSTGISINRFRKIISQSFAKRKIVILDACHSGGIHNGLSNNKSLVTSVLNKFEGEYVISSSSEDEPSLYPIDKKDDPTYFTGKLIDILRLGLNNDKPYITISDIFKNIYSNFKSRNLPLPQQSNFDNVGDFPIIKNNSFTGDYNDVSEAKFQVQNNNTGKTNNVKIVYRKNVLLNVLASVVVVATFVSFIFVNLYKNNEDTIVLSPTKSNYEVAHSRAVNHLGYTVIAVTPATNLDDVNTLINRAKIFSQADGGYNRAIENLNKALSIDPNNTEAQSLKDSLELNQN